MFDGREGLRAERFASLAVLGETRDDLEAVKADESFHRVALAEFSLQDLGIGIADTEGNEGADVSKDCTAHRERHLLDVLVCQREAEAVFACLGKNGSEGIGGEVVEFVEEQKEVAPFAFGLVHASHRAELELRGEQATEQVRLVRAKFSFREIGDENAASVHHKRDAHFRAHLAENVSDNGIEQELPQLVLNWRDGLALEARFVLLVFVRPERAHERVAHFAHDAAAVIGVGEHPVHAEQGSVRTIEKRGDGVVEDVFEARPPRIPPDAFERSNNSAGDKMPVVGCDVGDEIEADGEVEVAGIEIHQIVGAMRRDAVEEFFGEVTVWVNQCDAVPGGNVLHDEIAKQCCFSRTRFSDEVEVLPAVGQRKTDGMKPAPNFACADV